MAQDEVVVVVAVAVAVACGARAPSGERRAPRRAADMRWPGFCNSKLMTSSKQVNLAIICSSFLIKNQPPR